MVDKQLQIEIFKFILADKGVDSKIKSKILITGRSRKAGS